MTAESVVRLIVEASLRGGLVLALAAATAWGLRRCSAELRHAVWLAGLLGMLLIPALTMLLPHWTLPILPSRPSPGALRVDEAPISAARSFDAGSLAVGAPRPRFPSALGWSLIAWLAGCAALAAREFRTHRRLARLISTARPSRHPRIRQALSAAGLQLGLRSSVECRVSPRVRIPLACGVLRPLVILPECASEWSAPCLRGVLLHELSHLRRRDPLWILIAHASRALYWFHPFVWFAARQLRTESELACDDAAVRGGERPSCYAETLLFVASGLTTDDSGTALAFARRAGLEPRISRILANSKVSRALGAAQRFALGAVAALIALTTAMARPVASGASDVRNVQGSPTLAPEATPVQSRGWLARAPMTKAAHALVRSDSRSPVRVLDATVRNVPHARGDESGLTMPRLTLENLDSDRRVTAVRLALDLPTTRDRMWCRIGIDPEEIRELQVAARKWSAVIPGVDAPRLTVGVLGVRFGDGTSWDAGEIQPVPPITPAWAPTADPDPAAPSRPRARGSVPAGIRVSASFPEERSIPARFRNPHDAAVSILEARTPLRAIETDHDRPMTLLPAVRLVNRSDRRIVALKLRYKADPKSHAVTVFETSLSPGEAVVMQKVDYTTRGRASEMTVQVVGARFEDGGVWGTMDSTIDTRDPWVYPVEPNDGP